MTVFNTGLRAVTNNFNAGDIGYIKANFGHCIKNVGDGDGVPGDSYPDSDQDISLSDWLAHTPPAPVAHFNLSAQDIAKFPANIPVVMPL